jgi:hypothetical protein
MSTNTAGVIDFSPKTFCVLRQQLRPNYCTSSGPILHHPGTNTAPSWDLYWPIPGPIPHHPRTNTLPSLDLYQPILRPINICPIWNRNIQGSQMTYLALAWWIRNVWFIIYIQARRHWTSNTGSVQINLKYLGSDLICVIYWLLSECQASQHRNLSTGLLFHFMNRLRLNELQPSCKSESRMFLMINYELNIIIWIRIFMIKYVLTHS